jgi:uncharacterized YkwD family protein
MIPLRVVQENLNATVRWDGHRNQIISQKNTGKARTQLIFTLNSPYLYKDYLNFQNSNESEVMIDKIDVPAKLINNRTMIPLRSGTESFGYGVRWVQQENAVYLTSGDGVKPTKTNFQYEVDGDISLLKPIEVELFFLTNAERIKFGVKPLILDIDNSKVARVKSKDLHDNKYFEHNSPKLGTPFEMLKNYGISYKTAGENLAAGYKTVGEVTKGWMNSPGHKENLLREKFERVGFGFYEGPNEYKRYYTQIFTTK